MQPMELFAGASPCSMKPVGPYCELGEWLLYVAEGGKLFVNCTDPNTPGNDNINTSLRLARLLTNDAKRRTLKVSNGIELRSRIPPAKRDELEQFINELSELNKATLDSLRSLNKRLEKLVNASDTAQALVPQEGMYYVVQNGPKQLFVALRPAESEKKRKRRRSDHDGVQCAKKLKSDSPETPSTVEQFDSLADELDPPPNEFLLGASALPARPSFGEISPRHLSDSPSASPEPSNCLTVLGLMKEQA